MKTITRILLAIVLVVFCCLVFNKSPYDNYLGDRCPKCKSTHVGKFFYGLYDPEREDSATLEKNREGSPDSRWLCNLRFFTKIPMHRLPFHMGQIYLNKKGNYKYRVVKTVN